MKTILILLFTALSMAALAQDTSVVQVEYFYDADNGVGNNTLVTVTPAADGTFPFTASISGLAIGYHKLYIRTKDSNGKWSHTTRRNVEVFASDMKTTLVSGEYFIDADPGFGAAMPIVITSPDSSINLLNFPAATSGLSVGYHKLYGRLKDDLGRWSQTFRRNIEVYKNDTNYITKAEYFFTEDKGFGNCDSVVFASPSADGTFSFNIPLNKIPAGADTLFIRVQDSSENKWSITTWEKIPVVLPLTLLDFNVVKQGTTAQLNWQTTNEVNTSYFDVQRSTNGIHFTSIGKVTAKGNSSINNNYSFADDISPLPGGKIYYRLQITDADGKISYSSIKVIDVNGVFKVTIMPNPVINSNATFTIFSPVNARLQLVVYNELGTAIYSEQLTVPAGSINKIVNLSSFVAGNYWVRVTNGSSTQIIRFIKQ